MLFRNTDIDCLSLLPGAFTMCVKVWYHHKILSIAENRSQLKSDLPMASRCDMRQRRGRQDAT